MRPQHLAMEGFLAYRQRAEVDFSDADLFVLSGPTGSGKSSVIDAMTFALYGTIPRLDDRRAVAPVISAQADRARVSFRFSVGDEVYTAARLVERAKGGARVTEARLVRGEEEEVLAGNADEVTAEVTALLGLGYDHFTKAVVLPQGAFADFLTDRPKDRQALLKALLELGLYEQIMQLANLRARVAEARAETIRESLDKLDVPAPEHVELVRTALTALIEAGEQLPSRLEQIRDLERNASVAQAAVQEVESVIGRLSSITPPSGLETLLQDRDDAVGQVEAARAKRDLIASHLSELDRAIAGHRDLDALQGWLEARRRLESLRIERVSLDLDGLRAGAESAASSRDAARASLERARVEHAAHALREELVVGDPCPVCLVAVTELPPGHGDRGELDELSSEASRLDAAAAAARDSLSRAEGEAKQIESAVGELDERLAGAPDSDVLEKELAALGLLLAQSEEAGLEVKAAAEELVEAQATLAALDEQSAGLRDSLLTSRDKVASESPPLPEEDPVEGWSRFEAWRAAVLEKRRAELADLAAAMEQARAALAEASMAVETWLEGLGVDRSGAPERDLALAVERRSAELRELEKSLTDAAEMERQLDEELGRARVASALGIHLRANNFEAWVLEEAMEVLIDGANQLLVDLSAGCYSLQIRDSQFEVIDHRNARLARTTRSLSGGETFLVALALALSMAEQLAALTGTSSRLESVFIDEGFGSLDQESLDVVANVLDELVGRGRTVGIVTHVRELAERMPFRFEVVKGPETAAISKVS